MWQNQMFEFEQEDSSIVDYYEVIGCSQSSSTEQILTEYRIRALSCHPDKNTENPNATAEFALLQTAKDILTDPEQRKDYDLWKNSGLQIPYTKWKAMRDSMKMSMHWGVKTSDPMIQHGQDTSDESLSQAEVSKDDECARLESRDEMRRKFRNYEI